MYDIKDNMNNYLGVELDKSIAEQIVKEHNLFPEVEQKLELATNHILKFFKKEGWQSTYDVLVQLIGKEEADKKVKEFWNNEEDVEEEV